MKVIKFRAWDKQDNQMTYFGERYIDKSDCFNELMQFIGVCDKNGKEIYEYDIVKIDEGYTGDFKTKEHYGVVMFCDDCPAFIIYSHHMLPENEWTRCEVVGNIFMNRDLVDLLEEEEKQIAS